MLGTGEAMVDKKVTIPKNFRMEIGTEKQVITVKCYAGIREGMKLMEHKKRPFLTN